MRTTVPTPTPTPAILTHDKGLHRQTDGVVDNVDFVAFAPDMIRPNSSFVLEVWAHLPAQFDSVLATIERVERYVELSRKSGVSVMRGATVSVELFIEGFRIPDPVDTITWNGHPTNASFAVIVPGDTAMGCVHGAVIISCAGIQISKIPVLLNVGTEKTDRAVLVSEQATYPNSAFASYSRKNKREVLARIHGMKKIMPCLDVFLDKISLKSGDLWKTRIEIEIGNRDVFYLFWSSDAALSEMVEFEWRAALRSGGLDFISPVPLEQPDKAPPPMELSDLHFSDMYLDHMES